MSWESALDCVVARTGHERFRQLCSDASPGHAGYRRLMIRMAGGNVADPAPIPLAESLGLLRLVNSCPYRSRDAACGCSGFRCALRMVNPVVNHLDCLECVRNYDNSRSPDRPPGRPRS